MANLEARYAGNRIAVVIETKATDLRVRELYAYLSLADRVYGRTVFGSLERYSRRRRVYLRLGEVRRGSLVLVLREALEAISSPHGVILTGLVLKFLPDIIKAPAAAYRDFEEGRFRRAERKQLMKRAQSVESLRGLTEKDRRLVVGAVAQVLENERHRMASAQTFAIDDVESVRLESLREADE